MPSSIDLPESALEVHVPHWLTLRVAPGANLIAFSFRPISAKVRDAPAREDQVDPDVRRHWKELPFGMRRLDKID
jgi:hypothetical protein